MTATNPRSDVREPAEVPLALPTSWRAPNHIQTAPEPHPAIVCGNRETRVDGSYECVRPPAHVDLPCYFVRIVTT